jgi:hypothetical protein
MLIMDVPYHSAVWLAHARSHGVADHEEGQVDLAVETTTCFDAGSQTVAYPLNKGDLFR